MFYSVELLHKRGKFGLIWLAATKAKKLHRRQICSVNITQASEDVKSVLNHHILTGANKKMYFSLFLSSQLMGGLVHIIDLQTKFLLDDLKTIILKLGESKSPVSHIDLSKSLSKARVTLKEVDMDIVFPDFGCLVSPSEMSEYHQPNMSDYFLVTTPKSSEPSPDVPLADLFDMDDVTPHLARREDITLTDSVLLYHEEPVPEMDAEPVDIFAPPYPFVSPPSQTSEIVQLNDLDTTLLDIQTPVVPTVSPAVLVQPRDPSALQTPLSTDLPDGIPSPVDGFVLPPTVPDRKPRKRKRNLKIDTVTSITAEQMRKNISSANNTLTVPMVLPGLLEPASSLISRLGSGFLIPKNISDRCKKLKTLLQPEEDFGIFIPEEILEDDTAEVSVGHRVSESAERERAQEEVTVGSGLLKSTLIKTFDGSSSLYPRLDDPFDRTEGASRPHSLFAPDDDQFMEVVPPHEEVSEGEALLEAIPDLTDLDGKIEECVLMVSPERTLPPPSPVNMDDVLREAMELLEETVAASVIPNITTFNAMLKNTVATKMRVASLFNSLLCLHSEQKIFIQQTSDGEIFIEVLLP